MKSFLDCPVCMLRNPIRAAMGRPSTGGIIDVHAHMQVASYLALAAEAGLRRPNFGVRPPGIQPPSPAGDDEAAVTLRIGLMDAAGVRMQVLSPTLAPYISVEDAAARAARLLNDRHAALVREYPARFASFVSLPLPHVEASLREMRRGLDELGMVGVTLQCACLDRSIADDLFDPLFREMNARGAVLFLHPAVNGLRSPFITDWGLTAAAGPLLEDATVALHLMVKGIPVRYPDIKIIVPHLGGGLSGYLERLDNQMLQFLPDLRGRPSEMARGFWYDTVSHGSRPALRAAVDAFGADKLLAGSDFPVLLPFESYSDTFGYIQKAGLSRREARCILYENASRLLKL
jgi:predicted TIM-barrel fold metal-dependent hydrolase